jgi:hypothetical protein
MITFVSSFIHGINSKRSYDTYKLHFDRLVATNIPIVLFLDIRSSWTFPDNVHVIHISIEDTWVGKNVTEDVILPQVRSPEDTLEYMKIINSKTEFVLRASQLNIFQTEWFAWIDFGINHVFQNPSTLERIRNLTVPTFPCIKTAGIWNTIPENLFDRVCWRYAGGFFLAHSTFISQLHYQAISSIQRNLPNFAWEVNTWTDIERNGYDLGWFPSDHNDSIIPFTSE